MSLALIPDPAADGRKTATCYEQCTSLFLAVCALAPPVLFRLRVLAETSRRTFW